MPEHDEDPKAEGAGDKDRKLKDAILANVGWAGTAVPFDLTEVKATPLGPLTRVGYDLARLVLGLTASAFVILTIILAIAEFRMAPRRELTYPEGLAIAANARLEVDDARWSWLRDQFDHARADPAWVTPEAVEVGRLIDKLQANPELAAADKPLLEACRKMPPAAATGREDALRRCAAIVDRHLPSRGSLAERVKMIQELQKQAADDRQAFRAFWLQMAQMILLNLFFPLLTALLGYIFGTQQAQKTE